MKTLAEIWEEHIKGERIFYSSPLGRNKKKHIFVAAMVSSPRSEDRPKGIRCNSWTVPAAV